MHGQREALMKALKTVLYNQIAVNGEVVQYYVDYFGDKDMGIYLQSYQGDNADNKHFEGELATITLVVFAKNKTVDFVAEASRKVRQLLKASVTGTIALVDGYNATYTNVVVMSSETLNNDGAIEHRDSIRFEIMINVNTNEG